MSRLDIKTPSKAQMVVEHLYRSMEPVSYTHLLGGWFHIPHGTANALLFPFVCRFNAQRHPYKMGTFSQYKYCLLYTSRCV